MADNTDSTGTFKKSSTFKKVGGTFAKPGSPSVKPNDALGNILSFGQTAIDTISTPLYFVSGLVNASIDNAQGERDKSGKTYDVLKRATDNAFAWQSGKKVTTGKDILTNLGYLKPGSGGADDPNSVAGFTSGLMTDILLDPLTYTPAVLITAPLKVAATTGRAAIRAANIARKGDVAAELVAGAKNVPVSALKDVTTIPTTRKPIVSERLKKAQAFETEAPSLKTSLAKAGDTKIRSVLESVMAKSDVAANYKYQTVKVNKADRDLMGAANQIALSGIIAGRRAMADTILSISAREWLTKHSKDALREAKRAGTKLPATALPVASYEAIRAAEQAIPEMTTAEAVQITSTTGEKAEFAPYTAYEYDNGVYVGDGKNIYKFNDVNDAERWITETVSPTPAPAIREVTVGKAGKGYNVAVNGEATRTFKTKKEADAYANTVKTGERVEPVMAPTRRSGEPILDLSNDNNIVTEIQGLKATDADVKKAQATLKALDAIAKKAVATRSGSSTEVASKIRNLLGIDTVGNQRLLRNVPPNIWKNMSISLKNEIGYGPFQFINELISKSRDSRTIGELLKLIMNKKLSSGNTIGAIYDSGAIFNKLSRDGSVQKEITDAFRSIMRVVSRGNVKGKETLFNEITKLAGANGEAIAKAIEKTGFLDTLSDESVKKVNEILSGLDVAVEEVKYNNLSELIAGMRDQRHNVDSKTLLDLLKRLDPDNADITRAELYAGADANTFLSNILLGEGVQNVSKTRRLVELSKDPDILFKSTGVAYSDLGAAMVIKKTKGGYGPEDAALEAKNAFHSRQAAAERIADDWGLVLKQSRADSGQARWATAMSTALDARLADIVRQMNDPNSLERLTTLGDAAITNGLDPYVNGSEAILKLQLNQYVDTKIFGSLNGTLSKRDLNAVKGDKEKVRLTAEERVRINADDYDKVRDGLLATIGGRPRISKARDDIDYQAKLENEIYDNQAHFVFLDNGDIMRAFLDTDAGKIMEQAFYPGQHFGWKKWNAANDTFSIAGVDDMVRRMIEIKEADGIYNREELIERALSRATTQGQPSDRFLKVYRPIAENMVDHLINDPRAISALEDLHKSRLIATINDSFNGAQSLSEDVYNTLIDGWRANYAVGKSLSDAERRALVRDNFRKFVYASGIMRLKGGDVAEAVFRAAGMSFIDGGRLKDLAAKRPHATIKDTEIVDNEETVEFLKNYYAYRNTERAAEVAPTGPVEPQIIATKKQREKIEKDYTEAKLAYEEVMRREPELANDAARKKWEKDFDKIQSKLDDVRYKARQVGYNTQHYVFGKWVDSAVYNQEAALKLAEQQNLRYLASEAGVEDRARFLVDTRPELPKPKKLTKKQREALLENFRAQDEVIQLQKQQEAIENAAQAVADDLDAGKFDNLDLSEAEKGQRALQEAYTRSLQANEMVVHVTYNSRSGIRNKTVHDNLAARTGERIYGPSGRWNTVQLIHERESTSINRIARFAEYLDAVRKTYTGVVNMDDFATVWANIVNDIELPAGTPDELITFRDDLKRATDLLIKSADTSELTAMGLDGKALESSFRKYGITEAKGIPPFGDKSSREMVDWLRTLPFAKRPAKILDDTEEARQWTANAAAFAESGEDPFLVLTRVLEAVEMAKGERTLALEFTNRFGWKAAGFQTPEAAIKAGWVKIKGVGAKEGDLTQFLPEPENGALFPPEIAEEFGSLVREWNELYNNRMPDWTKTIMEVQGFLKATQTILRAGHHVTNFVGDVGTAMIVGVRNPIHWQAGWRLTQKSRLSQSAIGEADRRLDRLFGRAFRAFDGEGKAYQTVKDGQETLQFALSVNGKSKLVDFSDDDIINMFERRGIFISNIFANDIQGLADNIIADTAGPAASVYKKIGARFTSTARKIEKPAGDFAAWYGNATRGAHALKVMQSQAWASIDDALDAAADAVNKFHPTVQSLSSTERKWPRFAFSYYTWIRVAHNAMVDMALNHTAAFTFYSKVQYNLAAANNQEPASFGQPFADKTKLPGYMSYSVFGPTSTGPRGGLIFKPAVLPLDVSDFWNITIDPRKTMEQNVFINTEAATRTLGKSINLIVQPGIEAVTQTDLATGKPLNIEGIRGVADQMIGNLGFATLLKGLNLYTPQNKLPENTSNPLTDRDRQLNLINWMTGLKFRDTMTPADMKNAKNELAQRTKEMLLEQYKQETK